MEYVEILNSEDLKCVGKIGIPEIRVDLEILKILGRSGICGKLGICENFEFLSLKGVGRIGICGILEYFSMINWNI